MNAKIVLASLVALATLSPLAHADTSACLNQTTLERGACADAGGYAYGGGCGSDNGYTSDGASANVYGPDSGRGVNVFWSCYQWSYVTSGGGNNTTQNGTLVRYAGQSLGVSAWSYHDGQWHDAAAQWYSYSGSDAYGSWQGCDSFLRLGGHVRDLGCPVGEPPAPPVVLP